MVSINKTRENYKVYLQRNYPKHFPGFRSRERDDKEAATAEAAIFSLLRELGFDVAPAEDPDTGGVDFSCTKDGHELCVEVSNIDSQAITDQTGISNDPLFEEATWYSPMTHPIRTKLSNKVVQTSKIQRPCIVALTTSHIGGGAIFGPVHAEHILTSDTKISVPVMRVLNDIDSEPDITLTTDLGNAAFFRFMKDGQVELCRVSISALLLVQLTDERAYVLGVMHPEPKFNMPIGLFPNIPFVRVKTWPPVNRQIDTEWSIEPVEAARISYQEII